MPVILRTRSRPTFRTPPPPPAARALPHVPRAAARRVSGPVSGHPARFPHHLRTPTGRCPRPIPAFDHRSPGAWPFEESVALSPPEARVPHPRFTPRRRRAVDGSHPVTAVCRRGFSHPPRPSYLGRPTGSPRGQSCPHRLIGACDRRGRLPPPLRCRHGGGTHSTSSTHRANRLAPFPHVKTPHCDFMLQFCSKTPRGSTPQIGWPAPPEFTHAPPATTHIPGKKAAKPRRPAVVTHNEAPRIGPRKIPPQNELHRRGSPPPATGHGCPAPAPGSPLPWAA